MFKKVLLIVVVSFMALVMLAVAVAGVAATAGLATAAAVISDSGVVQAFEEVADGADRLQIDLAENSVTFTNPDSGESRTVTASERLGRGRVQFDLPQVTVDDVDGDRVVISPNWYVENGVQLPEITITDPDTGESRVIVPSAERFDGTARSEDAFRAPRVVVNGHEYGPFIGLRMVGEFFRGLFTLAAVLLIAAGAYLLLRNRRRNEAKVEMAEHADPIKGDDNS